MSFYPTLTDPCGKPADEPLAAGRLVLPVLGVVCVAAALAVGLRTPPEPQGTGSSSTAKPLNLATTSTPRMSVSRPAVLQAKPAGRDCGNGEVAAAGSPNTLSNALSNALCSQPAQDSVYLIVADTRTRVRLQSLHGHALEILGAVGDRPDMPVGVNLFAAVKVYKVLLVAGQNAEPDRYQILYANSEGEISLLLELSSQQVDEEGYEPLAFESLLAYGDAVDGESLGLMASQSAENFEFPHKRYPPVSYESALKLVNAELNQIQPTDGDVRLVPVNRFSSLGSGGESSYGPSLAYEVSIVGAGGRSETRWVDAFSGAVLSPAELGLNHPGH